MEENIFEPGEFFTETSRRRLFEPGQLVRVLSKGGYRKDSDPTNMWNHFVEQFSVVTIIKFEKRANYNGYYIHAAPKCFTTNSAENGRAKFGYTQGVQFIIENELEFVERKPVNLIRNPTQLPQI